MAKSGGSRIHPVSMDILPSVSVHRGTMETVPYQDMKIDIAAQSGDYHRIAETQTLNTHSLTLQEARWSNMRTKIPGAPAPVKSQTQMYVNLYDPQEIMMKEMRQFVRQHFRIKDCSKFIPAPGQKVKKIRQLKCHCGDFLMDHAGMHTTHPGGDTKLHQAASTVIDYWILPKELQKFISRRKLDDPPSDRMPQLPWTPDYLRSTATNTYGKIEFVNVESVSGKKPAKYIRMLDDDNIDNLIQLMVEHWKIMEPKAPNLVISVVGGAKNFKLDGRMRDTFSSGLIKAAKTTSAWLISSGFNMGVMKAVGQAVRQGQSFSWDNNRMAHILRCIGIAPWGYVKNRRCLESLDGQGKFCANYRTSNVILHGEPVPLNPDHTHFIFVDDGKRNRYGGVAGVRAKLEQKIQQSVSDGGLGIPVVLVVVEGGTDAITDARTSLEHRIPVVVCSGTGRAADLLAFAYSHTKTSSGGVREMKEKHISKLRDKIYDAYGKTWQECDIDNKTDPIQESIQFCCQNADLMIIFNINKHEDLDLAILSVLLKAHSGGDETQRLTQLKLALTWNRVDIAQEEIFREDVLWKPRSLDEILTEAILTDKVKFMELILQQGVIMREYLTMARLEELYMKVPKHHFIYELMYKLLGKNDLSRVNVLRLLQKMLDRYSEDNSDLWRIFLQDQVEDGEEVEDFMKARFKRPYKHLMIYAVLLNRQSLAKFCWEMGDEPVTSAIAATRIYNQMARVIPRHETNIKDTVLENKKEFEELATHVLNECHHRDPEKAMMIVERKSPVWSEMTCLQFTASSNDQLFLSSQACYNSVTSTWKHGILSGWRTIILSVFCPLLIVFHMDFIALGKHKMKWFQKLATYYTSPIAKFTFGFLLYLTFICLHSYLVLVGFKPDRITSLEIVIVFWVFTYMVDKIHTFLAFPAPTQASKFRDWYGVFNWLEIVNFFLCFLGFILHLMDYYRATKVLYCINSVVFLVSIAKAYTASNFLGPKGVMINRQMTELIMFVIILLVFLLAYGVASQVLLYHHRSPSWVILKDIIYYPYWQLYGEIFLEELETEDGCIAGDTNCRTFHWLVPILLGGYLLFGNILLLNLLIAIFKHVFDSVEKNSQEIWKYQMYFLVMEYDQKTLLVPPFSIIQHMYLLIRWAHGIATCKTCREQPQKQELGKRHLEYLQLFEKEMMSNYLRKVKAEEMDNVETTINMLQKRVDDLTALIEDEVIADQQLDPVTESTFIMTSDGQMIANSMSTDNLYPTWPPVQSVLDVAEQVSSSVIPQEYYKRPLLRSNTSSSILKLNQPKPTNENEKKKETTDDEKKPETKDDNNELTKSGRNVVFNLDPVRDTGSLVPDNTEDIPLIDSDWVAKQEKAERKKKRREEKERKRREKAERKREEEIKNENNFDISDKTAEEEQDDTRRLTTRPTTSHAARAGDVDQEHIDAMYDGPVIQAGTNAWLDTEEMDRVFNDEKISEPEVVFSKSRSESNSMYDANDKQLLVRRRSSKKKKKKKEKTDHDEEV